MTPRFRKWLFETLYSNRYLYRFASTVPFAGHWRTWQRQVLSRIHGTEVLELGCGLGDLLADMLEAGYRCQAIEHSPEMAAAACDTLKKRKVGSPSLILQGLSQQMPFPAASFDTIISTFPSEYIYDPDTIAEVARVLRSGGRIIVIEGASLLPSGMLQPILLLLQAFVYGPRTLFGPRVRSKLSKQTVPNQQADNEDEIVTNVVSDAWFGRLIPLERNGLQRRSELVRSRRWEVYIIIGEKR